MKISKIASIVLVGSITCVNVMGAKIAVSTESFKQLKSPEKTVAVPLYGNTLWNQPQTTQTIHGIVNFDSSNNPLDAFFADDFQIMPGGEWSITSFYEPMILTGPLEFDPSTVIHVKIYRDTGLGVPTPGDPRLETPLWSTSASISDASQVSLTTNPDWNSLSNVQFTPTEPPVLSCGNYWISIYPENTGSQYVYLPYSESANLNELKWINPENGFGQGAEWQDGSNLTEYKGMPFALSGASMSSAMPLARTDFTGNGTNDLLWHNSTTGAMKIMEMNCMSPRGTTTFLDTYDTAVIPSGIADFTGDGKPDILTHSTSTGEMNIWEMTGTNKTDTIQVVGSANANLKVAGVADFDQDGDPDIAMFNILSGNLIMWVMNGPVRESTETVFTGANLNLVPRGAADMDSDGVPDIVLRNNSTGKVRAWTMNADFSRKGNEFVRDASNTNLELRGLVDINGDGHNDILNYNNITGKLRTWIMDGNLGIVENPEVTTDANLTWSVRN